jgi:DnaJ-class molecular chaperone
MEVIDYYYTLLNVKYDATSNDIMDAYNKKIDKYRNLPFLNKTQEIEVKELKKAKYVLTNVELRKLYDSIIIQELDEKNKIKEKETAFKKEKVDSQMMGNRIFSMIGIITPPQRNYDIDRNFSTIK